MNLVSARLTATAALLVLALVAAVGSSQEGSKDKDKPNEKLAAKPDPALIRKLVDQLKSSDFKTREKAAQELSKLDEVPDYLREATKTGDVESKRRAQLAIDAITAPLTLPSPPGGRG
jgi:hypothetical protein